MKPKKCQWCGSEFSSAHPTKAFCSTACKNDAGNYMASRGKVIMPMLLAWRAKRGRKGTSGAAAYREMQDFVDRCVAELAEQGVPSASGFYETSRREGSGASTWKDFDRRRPSREIDREPAQA
jgi:hypothetical protein